MLVVVIGITVYYAIECVYYHYSWIQLLLFLAMMLRETATTCVKQWKLEHAACWWYDIDIAVSQQTPSTSGCLRFKLLLKGTSNSKQMRRSIYISF